jgi:hypothetical protein
MSQPLGSNEIDSKTNYERKKRKHFELEELSEDECLNDGWESKKMKLKSSQNNLKLLRDKRIISRMNNKENNTGILSNDQIHFVKEVVNANLEKEKPNTEEIISKSHYVAVSAINFSIDSKNTKIFSQQNLLEIMGWVSSCKYDIKEDSVSLFSLEILIDKNEGEMIKFLLNFAKKKTIEFVEYVPINITLKLQGEDEMFYDELEIHKEDLGKMMKRLLNYKFK